MYLVFPGLRYFLPCFLFVVIGFIFDTKSHIVAEAGKPLCTRMKLASILVARSSSAGIEACVLLLGLLLLWGLRL